MEYLLVWALFAALVAWLAEHRGRSFGLWLVLALVFSPLVGLLALLLADNLSPNRVTPRSHVRCPDCRELVLKEARKCKYCGCPLVPQND